jgi:hypothetical protein
MFQKAKTLMHEHLQAFGVEPLPPILETDGKGLSLQVDASGVQVLIGRETVVEELPLVEWMVAAGNALLYRGRSSITPLYFGPESEDEDFIRVTEDIYYITDLAAIYQCYLQNPVEAYCIYDNAIELSDEESLHPIAVALGLSHPRGLEAVGFDKSEHADVFEEADFFKSVVTQKRPDLSLLVALQNAWQKQQGRDIKISVNAGVVRLSKA